MAVTTGHLEHEKAVTVSLRETIVARDRVPGLERAAQADAHKITASERDDARTNFSEA